MILSDFLYRQKHDNSNPHEVIPILYIKVSLKQNSYFLLRDKLSPGTNPGFLKSEKMLSFIYLYTPRCIRKYLCSLF